MKYESPAIEVVKRGKDKGVVVLCIACDGSCWKCQTGPEKC